MAEDESGRNSVRHRTRAVEWVARVVGVALGVTVLALSARLTLPVPGSSVPQSAQTLVVVLIGALGVRAAGTTLAAYVILGTMGIPVFSDGGSGWSHLVGPTGGYIVGFLLAGLIVGACADARMLGRWPIALGALTLGHVVILTLGWSWLAVTVGARAAYESGVAPFIVGGLVKSAAAAPVVVVWATLRQRNPRSILAPPPAEGGMRPRGSAPESGPTNLPGRTP